MRGVGEGYPGVFRKIFSNVAVHTQKVVPLKRGRTYWALWQNINLKLAKDLAPSNICQLQHLFSCEVFVMFRLGMG